LEFLARQIERRPTASGAGAAAAEPRAGEALENCELRRQQLPNSCNCDVAYFVSPPQVMPSTSLARLAIRQSRWALQRRAASSTTEAATNAASSGATKAKEGVQRAAGKAQEGLSRVSSSAGSAIGNTASAAGNAVSGMGGRAGAAISFVQSTIQWQRL